MPTLLSKKLLPLILFPLLTIACQQRDSAPHAQMSQEPAENRATPAPTTSAQADAAPENEKTTIGKDALNFFGTVVAAVGPADSLRKFVRTAELKFRVRDVLPATLQIEDIALRNQGFVTVSNVTSEVVDRQVQSISRDSALEITRYSVLGHLIIRVPYRQLDTALRSMNRLVDFLDYRHVKAEDMALQLMAEQLLQLRQNSYQQDLTAAAQSARSASQLEAADRKLSSRTAADQARIERLKLEDAIQFSTVEIDIYQTAQLRRQMIANTEFKASERSFWLQLGDGLRSGAEILQMLAIGLTQLWSIILLAVLVYFGLKKYRSKRGG